MFVQKFPGSLFDYSSKSTSNNVLLRASVWCFGQVHVCLDNGPEFVANILKDFLDNIDIELLRNYPGSPWENRFNERFNGTHRDEVLNQHWFNTKKHAEVTISKW